MQTHLKKLQVVTNYYIFLLMVALIVGIALPIRWSVIAYGIVEPVKKNLVKSQVEGVISEVLAQAGEEVVSGQKIARLRDPKIRVSQVSDRVEYKKAKKYLAYTREMHKKGYVSDNELREAELNYSVYSTKLSEIKNNDIVSPFSGTLLTADEFNLRIGDYVEPGAIIATVADLKRMQIKIRIPEHNISRIQVGNDVRVFINALPSMLYKTISGKISSIQPQAIIDEHGSNFIVIISLNDNFLIYRNQKHPLIPGMGGYAKIIYERSSFFDHVIRTSFDSFSKNT